MTEQNIEQTEDEQVEETDEVTDQTDDEQVEETEDGDTFPRAYVEELRRENARYRDRAKNADSLAERLHRARVEATGRLADPTDLPYDDSLIEDDDALAGAIDALLEQKPHLASRRVSGDIGQGIGASGGQAVSLGAMLRANA